MAEYKYTTVNGHEVIAGNNYITRDGQKITIISFFKKKILGYFSHDNDDVVHHWDYSGYFSCLKINSSLDLVLPWEEEIKHSNDYRKGWHDGVNNFFNGISKLFDNEDF